MSPSPMETLCASPDASCTKKGLNMKPEPTTISVDLSGGKKLTFETGKLAKKAHGSAVVRMGDNVILATAVANADPREGIDFFPLTVDYREYTYAGGRLPGGFIKRESRTRE